MSSHRDAPYWIHSDPTPGDNSPNTIPENGTPELPVETVEESITRIATELDTACPGTCNRRWRQAQRRAVAELERTSRAADPDGRTPDPKLVQHGRPYAERQPVWCADCASEILYSLGRLPDLAAACGARRDGQLAPPPPTAVHTPAVAPPSPSPGWDQVEAIVSWTAAWADRLAVHLRDTDPAVYRRDGFRGYTLTRSVAFLLGRKVPLLAAPFAEDFGKELLDLVDRSAKVGGIDTLVHKLRDPCFRCHRRSLERRDGADKVICRSCGGTWPEELFGYLAKHATERPG